MNTKHFIFLTTALTTFAAQCMNENDNKIITMQSIREKREALLQKDTCKHGSSDLCYSFKPSRCDTFSICLNSDKAHIIAINNYGCPHFITPNVASIEELRTTPIFKTVNINGCTILGAAAITKKMSFDQQWIYTQRLLAADYQPTQTDKQFAILNQYERCEKYILKILYFYYFMHVNNIPKDIINYIAMTAFNFEKPLFYIKNKTL